MAPQKRNNSNNTEGSFVNGAEPSNISLEAILECLISAQARMDKRMDQQLKNQAEHQTQMLNSLRERTPQDNVRVPPGKNNF